MDEPDEGIEAVEDSGLRGLVEDFHENVDASLRLAFRDGREEDERVHVDD